MVVPESRICPRTVQLDSTALGTLFPGDAKAVMEPYFPPPEKERLEEDPTVMVELPSHPMLVTAKTPPV